MKYKLSLSFCFLFWSPAKILYKKVSRFESFLAISQWDLKNCNFQPTWNIIREIRFKIFQYNVLFLFKWCRGNKIILLNLDNMGISCNIILLSSFWTGSDDYMSTSHNIIVKVFTRSHGCRNRTEVLDLSFSLCWGTIWIFLKLKNFKSRKRYKNKALISKKKSFPKEIRIKI